MLYQQKELGRPISLPVGKYEPYTTSRPDGMTYFAYRHALNKVFAQQSRRKEIVRGPLRRNKYTLQSVSSTNIKPFLNACTPAQGDKSRGSPSACPIWIGTMAYPNDGWANTQRAGGRRWFFFCPESSSPRGEGGGVREEMNKRRRRRRRKREGGGPPLANCEVEYIFEARERLFTRFSFGLTWLHHVVSSHACVESALACGS